MKKTEKTLSFRTKPALIRQLADEGIRNLSSSTVIPGPDSESIALSAIYIKKIFLILLLALFLVLPVFAQEGAFQEEILEGEIIFVTEASPSGEVKDRQLQKLDIWITSGSQEGGKISLTTGSIAKANQPEFKKGDKVLISYTETPDGEQAYFILDFVRRQPLIWLFLIFVALSVAIGGWRGVTSLLGMGISFLVIIGFILPQIYAGRNPVLIALVGSFFIVPVTFYLSHGLNKKTSVALVGTVISLVITGFLAKTFIDFGRLTGFASEEAGFLQFARGDVLNIKGLVLAGIIIGVLGVLDDITVAQSAVVEKLKEANPRTGDKKLFTKAMSVGRDHIASMVNTLVLVYTGAALPLLLLFVDNPAPFTQLVNYEIIAEEIVRTLVGSIGLILAVPITTFLAVKFKLGKK